MVSTDFSAIANKRNYKLRRRRIKSHDVAVIQRITSEEIESKSCHLSKFGSNDLGVLYSLNLYQILGHDVRSIHNRMILLLLLFTIHQVNFIVFRRVKQKI